ncbi:hypothetical protein Q3G72_021420 [Acer saccharum]|nr:hypothetical protein Q3G72_021420 [Acer saccharum]
MKETLWRVPTITTTPFMLEAKEVARLVPKIMKRKLSSDDDLDSDSTRFDDDAYSKQTEDDSSGGYVNAEHEDYHDNAIKN